MAPVAVLLGCALVFGFLDGFHGSSNIVATMISSRALSPRKALLLAACAECAGPFLFGVAVATTIGSEIVAPGSATIDVLLSGVLSAILWSLVTWWLGLPASSSHALIGGILGAALFAFGLGAIRYRGLLKVLLALLTSPLLGLAFGYLLMKVILFVAQWFSPKLNRLFKRAQIVTSLALALSHSTNDAQKTMGVIALGLVAGGYQDAFHVPWWVVAASAAAISLGIATGGWRLIHTLGAGFYRIRAVHGFSSQLSSALVILGAALLGGPISTTQVVSSAIMGVGSAERVSKVRWGVAGQIAIAWLLTIPVTAVIAAALQWAMGHLPYLQGT
jgi:PiT family inorganic phosphate transporter